MPSRSYVILVLTYKQCTIFITNLSKYKFKQLIYIIKHDKREQKLQNKLFNALKIKNFRIFAS
ncbi:hypothetical protein CTM50_11755 [Prevotella intermedia]|uniref:Uncharacterized protein n=1 Tax=Prevotella intermedia TaxID=28131 RepID=A0A2D3NDY4_PREIN|nr:hypothetical protein CTM50_11755 [Prevotella intermedia]